MKNKKHTAQSAFFNLRAGICFALVCAVAISAEADNIIVTNINDSGPGSLRQALADASDGDTITFAVTGAIQLTSGELVIDNSITISGPGADSLVLSGDFQTRILHVMFGPTVTIAGLTIRSGNAQFDFGGGILNDHATLTLTNCAVDANTAFGGGGIYNDGGSATLTLVDSTLTGNYATGGNVGIGGGGIYNNGSLTIINSTISGNFADSGFPYNLGIAGGIFSQGGTLTITNSTIAGNFAGNRGGGISSCSTLAITDSIVSGNGAGGGKGNWPGSGGGIFADCGTVTISNSTISGNSVSGRDFKEPGLGGGIYAVGTVTISNSTLSDNLVLNYGNGGCIWNGETVEIGNTILNSGQPDNIFSSFGTVTSNGYNLSSDNGGGYLNGPGDQINTDPLLGPLQDNGGPTFTHELLPGSPAIDAGDPNFTPPPDYDQRGPGFVRVFNGRIDIGSFEVQPQGRPTPTPRPRPTRRPRP